MEAFTLYLLKSSVWLTGFAAIFFLFLRNERFFVLNRIFLILGIVSSVVLPFFTWHYTVIFPVMPTANIDEPQVQAVSAVKETSIQAKDLLLYVYLLGASYLIYRLVKQTSSVWRIIRKSETLHFNSVKLIRSDRYPASFSFFSFVFVNPSTHEHEINEIVNHEQEHIRQRHWIDLLLFEILCTIQWFNPMIWIYGRFIRQNHEFLADEYALRRTSNPAIYRAALLNQMFGGPVISLANSFNYSINKKRFNMMKQITYSPFRKLKLLLVLPLIAGVFYAFAAPEYKLVQAEGINEVSNVPQNLKTVKGKIVKEDGTPLRGTSIVVKQGTNGTLSGDNGVFELKIENDTPLVFSFVGFESQEVKPDFEKEMVVTLKRQIFLIDAVGNNPSSSEIFKTSQPVLTFVDGKETSEEELKNIKPETIESVSVLKKKELIAKYGEKGKNGVVLITLKKSPSIKFSAKEANYDKGVLTIKDPSQLDVKSKNGKQPLLVIDGVFTESKKLEDIDPNTIESMSVWKDEKAIEKYGDQGKNGVIEIILKKDQSNNTKNENSNLDVVGYANDQKSTEKSGIQIRSTGIAGNPLIVVDGVISSKKVEDIDPKTIQAINVLKGEVATKKYSEKGKNGVLEISLKKEKEVFVVVEELPEYPGGVLALRAFVASTMKYPTVALENGIVGQVTVGFTVAEDGSVTDVKVAGGVDPLLDQEALRIVNSMPKWIPGKQRGMPVKVAYQLPINFTYPADYHPKSREKLKEMKTK
jgi:TonB family protein